MDVRAGSDTGRLAAKDPVDFSPCRKILERKLRDRGPLSQAEKRLAWIAVATVVAWMTLGHQLGLAQISVLSAVLLFVFRVADWQSIEENVNWGIIVMYGGAVALGTALVQSGAAHWLAVQIVSYTVFQPLVVLMFFAAVTIFLTEGISRYSLGTANAGMAVLTLWIAFRFFDPGISFAVRGLLFIAIGIGFLMTNLYLVREKKRVVA